MKAIILAAGEGKRLMPYTSGIPKCMVEVNGKPLIHHQIDVLRSLGINDIILVKGCHSDKIKIEGIKTYTNNRYFETNMVYSLFCAESELKDDVIISYGDIVYSKSILRKLLSSKNDISVVIDLNWRQYWMERFANPLDDAESLRLDEKGRIAEIGKPTKSYDEINGQYIGLMKFTNRGINILKNTYIKAKKKGAIQKNNLEEAYMTDLLQLISDRGNALWPVNINGDWVEIDTVKDLKLTITRQRVKSILADLGSNK